jgi:hypothetical protein
MAEALDRVRAAYGLHYDRLADGKTMYVFTNMIRLNSSPGATLALALR